MWGSNDIMYVKSDFESVIAKSSAILFLVSKCNEDIHWYAQKAYVDTDVNQRQYWKLS